MSGNRILLVDDERDFVDTLAARLEARGFKTDVVYTGEDAIEKVGERDYGAIILDVVMPGIDGIATLRRVLEINPELQVILLTGQGTVGLGVEAIKRGAADFLQKPADLDELLDKLQQAASKRMLFVEKNAEAEVAEILRRMGW
jgi:DNA-binding NtrC family response regulator